MSDWPELDSARDGSTFATLHLASQMLGKLRVAHAPWVNHGWHATLHPVAEGLAIEPIASDAGIFTLTLDLARHAIVLHIGDGELERQHRRAAPKPYHHARIARPARDLPRTTQ